LYKSVSTNGFEFNTPDNINPETSSILKIESVDDIDNIDISKVPVVFSLYYFKE